MKEFGPIRESDAEPTITTSRVNKTLLDEAVELALAAFFHCKRTCREHGMKYQLPWLVVMTDGVPTSTRHREQEEPLKDISIARELSVFVFGIGSTDRSELSYISPGWAPIRINDQKSPERFAF